MWLIVRTDIADELSISCCISLWLSETCSPKIICLADNGRKEFNNFLHHFLDSLTHDTLNSNTDWSFNVRFIKQRISSCSYFSINKQRFLHFGRWILYPWFRASWLYINKIQRDATVCRCLFTAKLLYMFRMSIAPIIRSTSNCNCSFWYRP